MIMIIVFISIFIIFLIWSSLMLKGRLNNLDQRIYQKIKINGLKTSFWKIVTF